MIQAGSWWESCSWNAVCGVPAQQGSFKRVLLGIGEKRFLKTSCAQTVPACAGEEYEKHFPLPKSLHQFQEREQSTQIQKPNSTPQNTKYLYAKWCSCKSDRISTTIKSLWVTSFLFASPNRWNRFDLILASPRELLNSNRIFIAVMLRPEPWFDTPRVKLSLGGW